jgi:AMP-binding enzyme C-terminal domain
VPRSGQAELGRAIPSYFFIAPQRITQIAVEQEVGGERGRGCRQGRTTALKMQAVWTASVSPVSAGRELCLARLSSGRAFQDGFEVVELGDLSPHGPGDHRCHELHRPGGCEIKGETHAGGLAAAVAELEGPGRAGGPRGDLKLQPPGRFEHGDAVVAVDASPARACQDLPVGGAFAIRGRGTFDLDYPRARLGEEVVAFVSLRPGGQATPQEVVEFAKGRLATNKYPREVTILDAIPLTSVGKLDRKALRTQVTAR